jgi:phosphoribosylamine--glycine ligase
MAKVLVIGGGGREQALAWKLAQSPRVDKVYVAPGNGGSRGAVENVAIDFTDVEKLLAFARGQQIDLTVIGQEAASDAGAVDAFTAAGLTIFGPTRAATRIESSKAFSKELMAAEQIPTAAFRTFTKPAEAIAYASSRPLPVVVKADGLATGKGVIICQSREDIAAAIDTIMVRRLFGDAGATVVVEDFLKGQEVSVHALCDGREAVIFPASQDHKQVFDGDKGPNTGGMGVIAPVPWVTADHLAAVRQQVVLPALSGLQKQGTPFTGCLYPGLMIDGADIKLLEFNARFGDPEAEVYMRLFDGDLYEVLAACAQGRLDPASVRWKPGFAVSVVLCSKGYPGDYPKGLPISGLDEAGQLDSVVLFHAATTRAGDTVLTAGGRVLNVTATGATLNDALGKAYQAVKLIRFDGMHYRTDIGRRP